MIVPVFHGEILKGILTVPPAEKEKMAQYVSSLRDGMVDVIVRLPISNRSEKQNSYYWGVIVALISQESGMGADAVHEFLKQQCGMKHEVVFAGRSGQAIAQVVPRSTTTYTTGEMEDYNLRCRTWASEFFGSMEKPFLIPLPNECLSE